MADGKGREGYHDPFAGIGGAAPARSALTLRIVLATFGLVVCATGAVVFWVADAPTAYTATAAVLALVALVDLGVVIRRKLNAEPG
jgi:Family of unknown function (DUF6343)